MAKEQKILYPQKYFLIEEACRHFGLKLRTFKAWRYGGLEIHGLHIAKGPNYDIIDHIHIHTCYLDITL